MKCLGNDKIVSKLIEQRVEQWTQDRVNALTLAVVFVMLDKCGLCKNTAAKAIGEIQKLCDSINKGYVSFADLEKTLHKEYDIKLEFKKKEGR